MTMKGRVKPNDSAMDPTKTGAIAPPILYANTDMEAAEAFLYGNSCVAVIVVQTMPNALKAPHMPTITADTVLS